MSTWRDLLPEVRRAAEAHGLEPPDVEFFEVGPETIYTYTAWGLPVGIPHWTAGRDYELERTRHNRGRGTILEIVFNLRPVQAYVLHQNSETENLLVAAHVMGHADLYARNAHCLRQRTDMDHVLRAAVDRITEYEGMYGEERVERVIDTARMLMWHATEEEPAAPRQPEDLRPDPYRRLFPERKWEPSREIERYRRDRAKYERGIGERDLLRWLIRHAPLDDWERDVMATVRELALYLAPQARVKILHEGWATFWHLRLTREIAAPWAEAPVVSSLAHAHVAGFPRLASGRLNPYWLGWQILESLDRRGVDLLELLRHEDDRMLLGRIDEEMVRRSEVLTELAARLEEGGEVDGEAGWKRLRDLLVASVPTLPPVEVEVADWDGRTLHLSAPVNVDEAYARGVLRAMARAIVGRARLQTPEQDIVEEVSAGWALS